MAWPRTAAQHLDPRVQLVAFQNPRLRQPLRQIKCMAQLVRAIQRFQPDVVHMQAGHLWFNVLAWPLLQRYPRVVTIHDPQNHQGDKSSNVTPQALLDWGYRQADETIVHASQLKTLVIDRLGISVERISVIPLVKISDGAGAPGCADTQTCPDHLDVLFFGRIWEYKGLDYLIRAEPLIHNAVPNARVVIAGRGEDFERYRRLMQHPDRFEVHNSYISDLQRDALFARAAVVVLPYIEASQSGVIPVAYSFGKPVVATTVGGLPDLVDDGRTGFLVAPRNVQALADATVRLLRDAPMRHKMGAQGKHKIETECSPPAVGALTLEAYRRAIRTRTGTD